MTKSYKISFVPFDASGHVNACLGLAQTLSKLGHRCVFVVNQNWSDVVSKQGFETRVYIEEHKKGNNTEKNSFWSDFMVQYAPILKLSSFEKIKTFEAPGWPPITSDIMKFNEDVKNILKDVRPDAIVQDCFVCIPAVVTAGVPWIDLISCNPLFYWTDERLPPGGSGYSTNGDKKRWKEFQRETIEAYGEVWDQFNQWVQSVGAPPLSQRGKFSNSSPYLNIYMCPKELDYSDIAPKEEPDKWVAVDTLIRTDLESNDRVFEIPECIRHKPGKLVYFSMGTMCCSELKMMRRLVSILAKAKHRFIVSKGPLGDELVLVDNMWGQNSVPQLQVLPEVDAVITHGGNNTVTECLYFGKPMIVLPVFSDQYDNAQRLQDKGLGVRLDPYFCTDEELLSAIDNILNDNELRVKYKEIANRMRSDCSRDLAAKRVIEVIDNFKNNSNRD